MLRLLREIVFLCSVNNCWIRAVHIAGVENRLADRLSRAHGMSQVNRGLLEMELSEWSKSEVIACSCVARNGNKLSVQFVVE